MDKKQLLIGIVGVCGSGKTELAERLKAHGFRVRHIAQEHSYAPHMWQQLTNPDILIYLDVSYEETLRRKSFNWNRKEFQEQLRRVAHARQHADLEIDTNPITPSEVFQQALAFVEAL